jgi:putative restriction endonuclease
MAVKLAVAVTDRAWFEQLRGFSDLAEVNFWSPVPRPFKALERGELFLFALDGFVVGGGVFVTANTLPCSLAWEAFGQGNGAASLDAMRARILTERPTEVDARRDVAIGCCILAQPFFWDEPLWIAAPTSFSNSFKTYDTATAEGAQLWDAVQARREGVAAAERSFLDEQRRYGNPVLVRPRLGQGAFRVLVTEAYARRCAVTAEKTLPALEAAHIRPYAIGGDHAPANGILLRRDIHSLFDLGYVTITPDLHFEVSRRIREEYEDGRAYYALHGKEIVLPARTECRPDRATLAWHNESVFLTN